MFPKKLTKELKILWTTQSGYWSLPLSIAHCRLFQCNFWCSYWNGLHAWTTCFSKYPIGHSWVSVAKCAQKQCCRGLTLTNIRRAVQKFPEFPCIRRTRDKIVHTLLWWGGQHVCLQAQQVSVCSVVTVPFELDVNVGHLEQCHNSNSMERSNSCASWENLLWRHCWPCSKFMVILH
jgi:hypothetical protein